MINSIAIVQMIPSNVMVLWYYGSRTRGSKANPIEQRITHICIEWNSNPNYLNGIPVYGNLGSAVDFYTVFGYFIVYYTLWYNLCEDYTESG